MKKRVIAFFILLIVLALVLMSIQIMKFGGLSGYVIFSETKQDNFTGEFENTVFNGKFISLDGENLSGSYISPIFDSKSSDSIWMKLNYLAVSEYDPEGKDLIFLARICDGDKCSEWKKIDVENINLRGRYIQYKAEFNSSSVGNGPSLFSVSLEYGFAGNPPKIEIKSPEGVLDNKEGLDLKYSVSDQEKDLDSCWFSLNNGKNESLPNCSGKKFNVDYEGSYVLTVYANDSKGNLGSSSISFKVGFDSVGSDELVELEKKESIGTEESVSIASVNFELNKQIVLKAGSSGEYLVNGQNVDKKFLNNCKPVISGEPSSWMVNVDSKGLSSGEKFSLGFDLSVPENAEAKTYSEILAIKCDEGQSTKNNKIVIYKDSFNAKYSRFERVGNDLSIYYSLEEIAQEDHSIKIKYSLRDFEGDVRASGENVVILGGGDSVENVLSIVLGKDMFGEFNLSISFDDGKGIINVNENIFLPSKGITGQAIDGNIKKGLSSFGVIFTFILIGVFGFWIYRNSKKSSVSFEKEPRKVIKLEEF